MKRKPIHVTGLCLMLAAAAYAGSGADALTQQFATPPHEAKPWAMWYWIRGNVTKEGIDADLQAMAETGLSGVYLMNIGITFTPGGSVKYMSPEYLSLLKHTFQRCAELNLKVNLYNCDGFSSSGGPWMTPDESMQRLVWTETRAVGPGKLKGMVKPPYKVMDYYRDEAVIAFPTPVTELNTMHDSGVQLSDPNNKTDVSRAADGDWNTKTAIAAGSGENPAALNFTFPEPFTARSLLLLMGYGAYADTIELQTSPDGEIWESVAEKHAGYNPPETLTVAHLTFPERTARHFRLLMKCGSTIQVAEAELSGGVRMPDWVFKTGNILGYEEKGDLPPKVDARGRIGLDEILDLTPLLQKDGMLDWDVPEGNWTILRFGYTTTGMENRPSGPGGRGLETDKFSKAATKKHFDSMLGRVADQIGTLTGSTLTGTHVDSWEVGTQNWSPDFAAEFQSRRGYSLRKYLPAMTGRIIDDSARTDRFLWDIRRTIADLIAENYYACLRELCNARGMKLSIQPERALIDVIQCAGNADVPVANVQMGLQFDTLSFIWGKRYSSGAHLYGRRMISSESLTARPQDDRWDTHPFIYKRYNDLDFTAGVNHQTLHVFTHQPWTNQVVPGMTLDCWGVHFDRANTWWKQAKPWLEYLQRTQFLLQQGEFVGDILYFEGDDGPSAPVDARWLRAKGYDYDVCDAASLLNSVFVNSNGKLETAGGRNYRMLVLRDRVWIRPDLMRKIHQLVENGAVVFGTAPAYSPSLENYPDCDVEVKQLASDLWKTGRQKVEFGKGTVFTGIPLEAALRAVGIHPDFQWRPQSGRADIGWIHYRIGDSEVYFVANPEFELAAGTARFAVSGRVPELWNPETGKRFRAAQFKETGGVTEVPLHLNPAESVFVVFPKEPTTESTAPVFRDISADVIDGPWTVRFQPDRGAPEEVEFPELISWPDHPAAGVKYFSGTAIYTKNVTISSEQLKTGDRLLLDLGAVHEIAEVRLNGRNLGTCWKPPFRLDVTEAAKPGTNTIEIDVTNLWPNRMIGDERMYPPDAVYVGEFPLGPALKEWPEWLAKGRPRPTGRITLSTWKLWEAKDELLPSGLVGPVRLIMEHQSDNP